MELTHFKIHSIGDVVERTITAIRNLPDNVINLKGLESYKELSDCLQRKKGNMGTLDNKKPVELNVCFDAEISDSPYYSIRSHQSHRETSYPLIITPHRIDIGRELFQKGINIPENVDYTHEECRGNKKIIIFSQNRVEYRFDLSSDGLSDIARSAKEKEIDSSLRNDTLYYSLSRSAPDRDAIYSALGYSHVCRISLTDNKSPYDIFRESNEAAGFSENHRHSEIFSRQTEGSKQYDIVSEGKLGDSFLKELQKRVAIVEKHKLNPLEKSVDEIISYRTRGLSTPDLGGISPLDYLPF